MDSTVWHKLHACCRDDAAFLELQRILSRAESSPKTTLLPMGHQALLFRVITKIRESLDLDTIFQTTATEVRQTLQADRVGVFRFDPNSGWDDGEFVSEDVVSPYSSAIAAKVHDHCFGESYAARYQKGQVYAIADIHDAALSDCHISILSQFQVRANLVVPLLQGDYLWGLLCIHQCSAPRHWNPAEIHFAQQVATHLSVGIRQAELLATTRHQTQQLAQALQDLRHSQTQLIQTEKMSSLGQLVAGVAHEINNPVNFIYGNLSHAQQYVQDLIHLLELYQSSYPDPPQTIQDCIDDIDLDFLQTDVVSVLKSMQVGTDRIRQIVLSLRNFSRIDESELKPANIHDGLDSTLLILHHRLKPSALYPEINVVRQYGNIPSVNCLPGQLNQVFMNLICNAIDALRGDLSQPEPQILIKTELRPAIASDPSSPSTPETSSEPAHVVITVTDNGPGIAPDIQPRLFDPFFTTKPVGEGTGLGLAISYKIITEHHQGTIHCQSEGKRGSTFQITIPLSQ
jgi:signal transduction histidine kinase